MKFVSDLRTEAVFRDLPTNAEASEGGGMSHPPPDVFSIKYNQFEKPVWKLVRDGVVSMGIWDRAMTDAKIYCGPVEVNIPKSVRPRMRLAKSYG